MKHTLIYNPQRMATNIAIIFHTIGLTGIYFNRELFTSLTAFNLLLSAGLLIYTQTKKNGAFLLFVLLCLSIGFGVEFIGVNYQWLFGAYQYLPAMGVQWKNVPLVIGVNWFIIIYCCGISVQFFLNFIWNRLKAADQPFRKNVGFIAIVIDGAILATFFDWLMEPVAIKLEYWKWLGDGTIPIFNYTSWFGVSAFLMLMFRLLSFNKTNHFAVNLLLIQFMFFLILRTIL